MKKVWKHLSFVIAAIMLLSMAACGNTPLTTSSSMTTGTTAGTTASTTEGTTASSAPSEGTETEATTTPANDMMTPFSPYPETITIHVARVMNKGAALAPGETTSKNGQIDVIKKKLNVDIVVDWETSPDQYNQKLSLSVAAGTLPDSFAVSDYLMFRALVENSALADLTESFDKCVGGQVAKMIEPLDKQQLASFTVDGKLFGLTGPWEGYGYNLLWIRNDWLKKVNLPAPRTLDDLKAVAAAFVKNNLGGDKTIGLALRPDIEGNSSSFISASPIFNAVGAFPQTWIKGSDGKLVYGDVAPEMKTALGILADWYQSGLIDPQFMTYKNVDEVTPLVNNGNSGMMFIGWWGGWVTEPILERDPKADWIPVLCPVDANGQFKHTNPMGGTGGGCQVVRADYAYPEAVVKALNVENEAMLGMYDNDPEIVAMLKPSRDASAGGRTISPFSGLMLAANYSKNPQMGKAIDDLIKTGATVWPDSFTPGDKSFAQDAVNFAKNPVFELERKAEYIAYIGYTADMLLSDPAHADIQVFDIQTESMADYWPNLLKMESEMITAIISGQKPLDYFDEFVTQWKAQGGDTITQEAQAQIGQ